MPYAQQICSKHLRTSLSSSARRSSAASRPASTADRRVPPDACLGEESVKELTRCIRLNLACADACETTGRTLSRQVASDAQLVQALLEACAQACRSCGDECEHHAREINLEHCRVCAEACRRCEQACKELLGTAA